MPTSGKQTPDVQKEWSFNRKVVETEMAMLAKFEGVKQLRLDDPTGRVDIPLIERSKKANQWGTNLQVDVYHNASGTNWVKSELEIESFIMTGTKHYRESMNLAEHIHPKALQAMGLKDRGINSQNLHMLREINAPAILTEGGFMNSSV